MPIDEFGRERLIDRRSLPERHGRKLLGGLTTTAVALVIVAAVMQGGDSNHADPGVSAATTQQEGLTLPPVSTSTATTQVPSTLEAQETTTTIDPMIARCIQGYDSPTYSFERDRIVDTASRNYAERYGKPPDDPAQLAFNALKNACEYQKEMGSGTILP